MKSLCLSMLLLCSLFVRAGEPGDTASTDIVAELNKIQAFEKTLKYQTGTVSLSNGLATVKIAPGFRFLGADDSRRVIEDAWGNLKGQTPLGMIVPEGSGALLADYAFIIEYEPLGFVKDEDADKINYEDLLKQMKEDEVDANKQRTSAGLQTLSLVGWAAKPYYDKQGKILYWAKEIKVQGEEEHSLNYNVRVLGRKGVLVLTAVSSIGQLDSVNAHKKDIISMVSFNDGNRYSDFDSNTDEIAAWTIGGLVAGKVLAKVGFFAIILKYIKLIVLALVAAGGAVWRRITGRKKAEDDAPAADPVAEPEPSPVPAEGEPVQ
jgi:uncharacterized membrane-anchored protein